MQAGTCMDDGLSSKRSRAQSESVDLTRKRILTAAVRVFSRDGFQGATTREIAREAGVNEVTIFRHFRTREELLHSTLKQTCSSLDTLIQLDENWRDDLFGRLKAYVLDLYPVIRGKEAVGRAFISKVPLLPEKTRPSLKHSRLKRKAKLFSACS